MNFSDHQHYQYYFQQQEAAAASAYDPSQSQYQSYDPYYAYHHQQQQFYDYSSTHIYPQHDPTPGPTAAANPPAAAAVEALSQLSQFAGTMDATERAMPYGGPPTMPHHQMDYRHVLVRPAGGRGGRWGGPLRGGSRRGGGPFWGGGGGRGNFRHKPPRQDGGAPAPSCGTERGRGRMGGKRGGRKQHQSASDSQPTHTATVPVVEQSAPDGGKQQASTQAPPVPVLPRHPFLPFAWCDICRVDCNSLEILEQHKNGKRHKKTVQRVEEIQRQQKLFAELQAEVMPDMMLPSTVTENAVVVGDVENVSVAPENITTAAVLSSKLGEAAKASVTVNNTPVVVISAVQVDDVNITNNPETKPNVVLTAQQGSEVKADRAGEGQLEPTKVGGATEAPSSAESIVEEPLTEGSTEPPKRRGGMKRKMTKFGRGGKRLKGFEPVRGRVPERPKERPMVCTLCNVLCETLVVFESHISGKKHTSKIKRFQGQGTFYGPITVYIPPNQPSADPTQCQDPLFYGLRSQEMLPHVTYMGPNGLQVENYGFHEGIQGAQDKDAEGGIPEPQVREGLENSEGEAVPANGDKEVSIMDNIENQAAAAAAAIDFA